MLLAGLDSTECLVDGTHMDGTVIDNALGGGAALVSYMSAMRTFAQCVNANIEVPGYCHGSLTDAKGKCRRAAKVLIAASPPHFCS